jgi:Ca2+-binding RTX toxin-like protein
LGTMVVVLVVVGGVAFAAVNYYCSPNDYTCQCPDPADYPSGVNCVGTNAQDIIVGNRNPNVGDTIYAMGGNEDNVNGSEGNDYLDGGAGDGDYVFGNLGNDTLSGGPGIDDVCDGGSGNDTRSPGDHGCEEFIQ